LAILTPTFGNGFGNECTPAGTWFGGSENGAKYLMTVVPAMPNHYTVVFQAAFKPRVPILTQYTGEMRHVKAAIFDTFIIAMVNNSELPPDPGADSTRPQVWAVRSRGEIKDCDTFEFEIDFFVVYNWRGDLVPFKDAPDTHRLAPGNVIRETYHRMNAAVCTECPARPDDGPQTPSLVNPAFIGPGRNSKSRQ
jgi:hypothetical protein